MERGSNHFPFWDRLGGLSERRGGEGRKGMKKNKIIKVPVQADMKVVARRRLLFCRRYGIRVKNRSRASEIEGEK